MYLVYQNLEGFDVNINKVQYFKYFFVGLVVLSVYAWGTRTIKSPIKVAVPTLIAKIIPTPSPTPFPVIEHYVAPVIPPHPSYTLIFAGDSMTEAFGENFDYLRLNFKKDYPNKEFGIFNYGFGSTNILSLMDRLQNETIYQGRNFMAILPRYFDIIFIESMGTNPLSQYSLDKGLQMQTEALDRIVAELVGTHPNSLIIFTTTIAPSQTLFGKGAVDLAPEVRNKWANERRAYMENHINYAKNHDIPLINIYEKTMDKNGLTLQKYLDSSNYIHPSADGVRLMSQMITDYLFQNKILVN